MAIFLVKFKMAKFLESTLSISGFASKPGAFITVHSGWKFASSSSFGLKNML
jgi:hypothetical protein